MLKISVDDAKVNIEAGGTGDQIAQDAIIAIMHIAKTVAKAWGCDKHDALFVICCGAMENIDKSKDLENTKHIVFPVREKEEDDA